MGSFTNLHFISSIIWSAASVHQQHQCISYRHWKIYLPIYINSGHISLYPLTSPDELQTPPDMLQTPPDTIRHGPDTTRYHHICIMYDLYGLKHHIVEISGDVTDPDGRTNEQPTRKDRATQLLICEKLSLAILDGMFLQSVPMHLLSFASLYHTRMKPTMSMALWQIWNMYT